jgi:hypothetical protein
MQESFWATLLRMEQKPRQPIWLTIPTAPQPGTHFRRTLEASTYGAMGTGYNAEGAAGLTGGWGMLPSACNVRSVQEELTGTLAHQYGTWLNHFEPAEEVAILYSISQGGWNYGLQSPMFFAFYTLAQINRPARLVTEDEVAAGALKSFKALVLVRQKAKLPDATLKAIESFAASGGKVLCDRDSDPKLPGVHLKEVAWGESLWPNGGNIFHNIIEGYALKFGPILQHELGGAGLAPIDCADGSALVGCKKAPGATLVVVTNNKKFPFDELFTADQQKAKFFRWFMRVGSMYYKDVRLPHTATLALRPDLAVKAPRVYDVFAGKELAWQQGGKGSTLDIDLSALQGRVLLLTEGPLSAPTVEIAGRTDDDPLATLVVRSPVPVPVRIRVGGQEVYRAATSSGSCDTFALGLQPGTVPVEVTELVTGQTQRAELPVRKPPQLSVRELPPVQIRDAERLRQVVQAKGLAIYVDPRQSVYVPAAQRLAKQLGNGAEVIFNPRVREYAVTWDPSAEQARNNQQIVSERVLGWRRMTETYGQWTGALKPAPVWNRPVLLFGNALDNRLLADLDQVTLLARPAAPELLGPGRAFVQPLAAPFWNGQDAAVILCADADGLEKAISQLLILGGGKIDASFALDEDGGARAEQRQLLGIEPQVYPKAAAALPTKTVAKTPVGLEANLPVSSVAPVEGGVHATLHSPGRNLVRLDKQGKVLWRAASGGFYQPTDVLANPNGEAIVSDDTFVWRHGADGKVLWKALANPVAAPGADGNVWVLTDEGRILVGSAGQILARMDSKDDILAASPDGRTIYVQRPGDPKQGRTRADSALAAVRDGTVLWSVPNLLTAEVRLGRDGAVLACIEHECMAGRDDLDWLEGSRLTAVDSRTGKILLRQPLGESLTDLHVSADGKHLAALGHPPSPSVRFMPLTTWNGRTWATRTNRFTRIIYLADTTTGVARRTLLPERGVWASAFSEDGKTFWAASRSLIGIDADTLAIKTGATERFVCLAARPEGGFVAGTAEGTVAWLDSAGKIERQVKILADLASPDPKTMFATLREAKLVEPGQVEPHSVPADIALVQEADTYLNMRGDVAAPRGDGIVPIRVALRFSEKGRYRFTLTLVNPKEETDKVGLFSFAPDNGKAARTKAVNKDRLVQTVDIEMVPGTTLITLLPHDWKTTPLMRTLTVRMVTE